MHSGKVSVKEIVHVFVFCLQVIKSELLEQMHSQLGSLLDKALKEAMYAFNQPSRNVAAEIQSR